MENFSPPPPPQTYHKRESFDLSTRHPFILSFVDSIRKNLHECWGLILELKFRIWWDYLCVVSVPLSESSRVMSHPNLTIAVNSKNSCIVSISLFMSHIPDFLKKTSITVIEDPWEPEKFLGIENPTTFRFARKSVLPFLFIFLHFVFFSSAQSGLDKCNLCAYE